MYVSLKPPTMTSNPAQFGLMRISAAPVSSVSPRLPLTNVSFRIEWNKKAVVNCSWLTVYGQSLHARKRTHFGTQTVQTKNAVIIIY